MNKDVLTDEEIKTVTETLSKLSPGFLPLDIFNAVARIYVTSTVEVIPFRRKNEKFEVLLTLRDSSDPFWGGLYHFPGSVIRADDSDVLFESAHSSEFLKMNFLELPELVSCIFLRLSFKN